MENAIRGKRWSPDRGHDLDLKSPPTKEGDEADEEVAEARRKTTSRRELAQQPNFEQVSPEVGELDEAAIDDRARGVLRELASSATQRAV